MAPALRRQQEVSLPGESDRFADICGTDRLHDKGRTLVDPRVEYSSSRVVTRIARQQEISPQAICQFLDSGLLYLDGDPVTGKSIDAAGDLCQSSKLCGK
ncbi:MAG: hypothetical protein WBM57_00335 [Woeseiaceae bacterium]